jgi:chromosome segregation ATPase
MAEAWIFSQEIVDFAREEREQREREQRILKDFEYVLSDLSEIEMDASEIRHALSSAEMDLESALEWLEVGDLKGASREIADALRKLRQALNDAQKVEMQAEESARYIKHVYFGEPLFPEGDDDDGDC